MSELKPENTQLESAEIAAIRALLRGFTSISEELTILRLVATLTAEQLNELCHDTPLIDELLDSIDNHLGAKPYSDQLLELFTEKRSADLDLPSRANLLHAIQRHLSGHSAERATELTLCAATGKELSALKNLIDATSDHFDLERLVFHFITNKAVRRRILEHIANEATKVKGSEIKILTDFDDTAVATLNDELHPTGSVYPGVVEFWTALDAGPTNTPLSLGDLVVVTARPTAMLGLVEKRLHQHLHDIGMSGASVLTGSLAAVFSDVGMSKQKLAVVEHLAELFPEYELVFIGDSGQGDVYVAEQLYKQFGERIKGVFIHDVSLPPDEISPPKYDRGALAAKGIYFFDTYAGAASKASKLGLISTTGLTAVLTAVKTGYAALQWQNTQQKAVLLELLKRELLEMEL
ncbi:MAG: App1 family protein [Propionibacteriaceae bacterium]|jgi:hypothetical protein|nr:App1 family protein [Propionibacteriaceae bacterium]